MTSYKGNLQNLRVTFLQPPPLPVAEPFVSFLRSAFPGERFCTLRDDAVRATRAAEYLPRLVRVRSSYPFMRLAQSGRESLARANLAWLPEAWLPVSLDISRELSRDDKPYVVTVWENLPRHFSLFPPFRRIAKEVLEGAALIHCITQGSHDYIQQLDRRYSERAVQIYPGVDLQTFGPLRIDERARQEVHRFLYVGRLVPEKGTRELLWAFEELSQRSPASITLTIAGEGSLQSTVERMTANNPRVEYVGRLDREALPSLMCDHHTLILPSGIRKLAGIPIWQEQFGYVLVEAMACGLTVIASDTGAIPEVIGKTGTLISLSGTALAKAMESEVQNRHSWRTRSQLAENRARRYFSGEANSKKLWEAVTSALEANVIVPGRR